MTQPLSRSVTFDRIADRYDDTRGGLFRGNDFADAIAPHLPRDARVVEPGIGTGAVALPLTERGFDVVGFDLAPAMLARAHARLGNRVGIADVHQLPIVTGQVDAVVTVWVLHVVADPARLVAEIARILRPGGVWCAISADEHHQPDDIVPIKQALDVALGRYRDAPERVREWAAVAGLQERLCTTTSPWFHQQSPDALAASIETRTWSSCWDLDDGDWTTKVQPHIEALRALPDPQVPRERVAAHSFQVFTHAGEPTTRTAREIPS
jgi:ubiquinone/menaquinone biosynthesis C-methylase UbiE